MSMQNKGLLRLAETGPSMNCQGDHERDHALLPSRPQPVQAHGRGLAAHRTLVKRPMARWLRPALAASPCHCRRLGAPVNTARIDEDHALQRHAACCSRRAARCKSAVAEQVLKDHPGAVRHRFVGEHLRTHGQDFCHAGELEALDQIADVLGVAAAGRKHFHR